MSLDASWQLGGICPRSKQAPSIRLALTRQINTAIWLMEVQSHLGARQLLYGRIGIVERATWLRDTDFPDGENKHIDMVITVMRRGGTRYPGEIWIWTGWPSSDRSEENPDPCLDSRLHHGLG
ncbi:hypothetical protein HRR83_004443 [Exophiala dermatitidis]|uniref:Uncharacterized protein n=1 Tax=Exophiala dermatitidis TaxID=5970 RepID=A0AAN6F060_EXODE|nr:hypothetical protein HRR74_004277 [Exophiala dermatitidis]KAJ4549168.1 hypothetical protein HRR77_004046 [Exophiala dermatitidis]KAJ4575460.1 hypothetical protein HRR79_002381 [Exophiala dermatitidis]KAJ4587471.1 hypothetical protein HRR82_001278 [Exophiala dermatitidis]KAJ4597015.1 hypothetical protein HRR83_004443 [Exophiala dermatitidis]